VSAPVLAAASLEPAQWRALIEGTDEETRRFILTLHPELAESEKSADLTDSLVEVALEVQKRPPPVADKQSLAPSLHEVVERIERRRRNRERRVPDEGTAASVPSMGSPALFRWECGPSGEIGWVEGAPRGALIGRSIARPQDIEGDHLDGDVLRAFAMRAPFRDGLLTLGGDALVSGEWKISGVPAFDPADGRFAGYRGIALRDMPSAPVPDRLQVLSDPDSLRELVHEIKTPLNAIIGFAEIIDGQFLGPADLRYRERAGEIVAQARILLGAIDDLDFAAKVHSARGEGRRVDLAELLDRAASQLREKAGEGGVEIEFARSQRVPPAAVEPELADRLIFRLCTSAIEAAQSGERLRVSVDQAGDRCRLSISRPAGLRGITDKKLFDPGQDGQGGSASLRLIRGLARIAGGDLLTSAAGFTLAFPRA